MVQFASYLRCVLGKTSLIFPRINGPNGRRRRPYQRPKLEANVTFNCDWLFTLFTFAPSKFRLFFASGICPGSLASCFTRNGPSFVKSCLISFCYSVQSSLVAKQTMTFGAASLLTYKADRSISVERRLICEFPENVFQPLLSSFHWKLLLCIGKKTWDMEIFLGVSAHSFQTNASSKLIAGSHVSLCIAHEHECHILSVNFISQQQDKSVDVKEIFSRFGFADSFSGRVKLETWAKKTGCSRRLYKGKMLERVDNVKPTLKLIIILFIVEAMTKGHFECSFAVNVD